MDRHLRQLAAGVVCAFGLASCTVLDTETERYACAADTDCLAGYACWEGACLQADRVPQDPCKGREDAADCVDAPDGGGQDQPDGGAKPTEPPSVVHSRLVFNPTSVLADGTSTAALTVTLLDRFERPVAGRALTLSLDGEGNVLTPSEGSSDETGRLTATLASTTPGVKTVVVAWEGGSLSGDVTFTEAGPDASLSSLVASVATQLADGTATSTLTATILDTKSVPMSGVVVTFTATGANNTLTTLEGTTNAAGKATARLASTTAETKTVTATFGADLSLQATITFVAGPPSGDMSTFGAQPASAVANGSTPITLTATLRDDHENLVTGARVTFASAGAEDTLSAPEATTDANGRASVTVTSVRAGTRAMTARFGDGQVRTVDATFVAGAPTAAASSLTTSSTTVAADGVSIATLSATVKDTHGNPVKDVVVAFTANLPTTLSAPDAVTGADGVASVNVSSNTAGERTFTATFANGLSRSVNVTFATGRPSGVTSTFVASATSAVANDVEEVTLTATVKDQQGNALSGEQVNFISTGSGNRFTPATATTDASGVATSRLRSSKAEAKTVSATFGGQTKSVGITFVAGAPVASTSTLVASATSAVANDVDLVTLTATIADAKGNPVGNTVVDFASSGAGNTLNPTRATTSTSGVASATIRTTKAESKNVTAVFGQGQTKNVTLSFVAGPPDAARTTFVASTGSVAANGVSSATLTATVKDVQGNPVGDWAVTFSATGGGNTLTPAQAATNVSGVVQASLASTVPGLKSVTATFGPSLTKTADVTFTCASNAHCDDGLECNGAEACQAGSCVQGTPAAEGQACVLPAGANGVCQANACVAPDYEWAAWPIPPDAPQPSQYVLTADTAKDQVTGLMWQRIVPTVTRTHADARAYCENLSLAGFTDWRLPTLVEFTSIVSVSGGPPINATIFSDGLKAYWVATVSRNAPLDRALIVDLTNRIDVTDQAMLNLQHARCVR